MEPGSVISEANDPGVIGSLTTIHLILIALLALVVIGVVILAARVRARGRRQHSDADEASERINEIHDVQPVAAPPPPPLADMPAVATAPLDDAPATLAADMESTDDDFDEAADDLTRMKGVGPKLAAQLAALGYPSYASIAALAPSEADAVDAQLGTFKGRLARDRVVEQATYLAKGDTAGFEGVFGKH